MAHIRGSLTRLLDDRHGPVRTWFETCMPNLKPMQAAWKAAGPPTILGTVQKGRGLVGAAVDYRIRYWFEEIAVMKTAAAAGARLFGAGHPAWPAFRDFSTAIDALWARQDPRGRVLNGSDEAAWARVCYLLALYEVRYRAGPVVRTELSDLAEGTDLLNLVDETAVADIVALTAGWADRAAQHFPDPDRVVCNPRFPALPRGVSADADLIVDGCLVDFKATTTPRADRDVCYQLLAYALADRDDVYMFEEVGFYLARIPILIRWPLHSLLEEVTGGAASLPELRNGFADLLRSSSPDDMTAPRHG